MLLKSADAAVRTLHETIEFCTEAIRNLQFMALFLHGSEQLSRWRGQLLGNVGTVLPMVSVWVILVSVCVSDLLCALSNASTPVLVLGRHA